MKPIDENSDVERAEVNDREWSNSHQQLSEAPYLAEN